MNRAADVLAARYGQRSRSSSLTSKNNTSIEGGVGNNITSIEIPAEVDRLIDNKAYYPKFRKLMREYPREVMTLVELAHTKSQPSRWFAIVTAKKNWERTLKFLAELFRVRDLAERVAKKLKTAVTNFIYQQVWRCERRALGRHRRRGRGEQDQVLYVVVPAGNSRVSGTKSRGEERVGAGPGGDAEDLIKSETCS
jgi:hypothetical protein